MPQIGWFEILIIVILAILIIGPKDFPVMLKKVGSWIGSFKNYFSEIQKDITDVESSIDEEISFEEDSSNTKENKKNERRKN
jgi:twin arginine-targeting protein translocase TatB|tara:strand:+ start:10 stop:255 length:246 start_codon:yes stop_codon:yes gene_type:complete